MRLDVVCFWDCGAILMGYGVVVAAVQDLWGAMGVLRLRCQPYGDLWGRCSCGAGPMGSYGGVVTAVWDLWVDPWVSDVAAVAVRTLWGPMGSL